MQGKIDQQSQLQDLLQESRTIKQDSGDALYWEIHLCIQILLFLLISYQAFQEMSGEIAIYMIILNSLAIFAMMLFGCYLAGLILAFVASMVPFHGWPFERRLQRMAPIGITAFQVVVIIPIIVMAIFG